MLFIGFSMPNTYPPTPHLPLTTSAISASTEGAINADRRILWPLSRATVGMCGASQQYKVDGIPSFSLHDHSWRRWVRAKAGWLVHFPAWTIPALGNKLTQFRGRIQLSQTGERVRDSLIWYLSFLSKPITEISLMSCFSIISLKDGAIDRFNSLIHTIKILGGWSPMSDLNIALGH